MPGWTGAEICSRLVSSPIPAVAVMLPIVKLPVVARSPLSGKPVDVDRLADARARRDWRIRHVLRSRSQQSQIVSRILRHDFGFDVGGTGPRDRDLRATLHDMAVGKDVTFGRDEEARALTPFAITFLGFRRRPAVGRFRVSSFRLRRHERFLALGDSAERLGRASQRNSDERMPILRDGQLSRIRQVRDETLFEAGREQATLAVSLETDERSTPPVAIARAHHNRIRLADFDRFPARVRKGEVGRVLVAVEAEPEGRAVIERRGRNAAVQGLAGPDRPAGHLADCLVDHQPRRGRRCENRTRRQDCDGAGA